MELIPGYTLQGIIFGSMNLTKSVDFCTIPEAMKRPLLIEIARAHQRLEELGIELWDSVLGNIIISEEWLNSKIGTVTLIDYGQARYHADGKCDDRVVKLSLVEIMCVMCDLLTKLRPVKMNNPLEHPLTAALCTASFQEIIDFIQNMDERVAQARAESPWFR